MSVSTNHLTMTKNDRKLYHTICEDRQKEYAVHIATMAIPDELKAFAADMTARFGPLVRVHAHIVDWITALMIVQYGEAVNADPGTVRHYKYKADGEAAMDSEGRPKFTLGDGWPSAFNPGNITRAAAWYSGKMVPGHITYLEVG